MDRPTSLPAEYRGFRIVHLPQQKLVEARPIDASVPMPTGKTRLTLRVEPAAADSWTPADEQLALALETRLRDAVDLIDEWLDSRPGAQPAPEPEPASEPAQVVQAPVVERPPVPASGGAQRVYQEPGKLPVCWWAQQGAGSPQEGGTRLLGTIATSDLRKAAQLEEDGWQLVGRVPADCPWGMVPQAELDLWRSAQPRAPLGDRPPGESDRPAGWTPPAAGAQPSAQGAQPDRLLRMLGLTKDGIVVCAACADKNGTDVKYDATEVDLRDSQCFACGQVWIDPWPAPAATREEALARATTGSPEGKAALQAVVNAEVASVLGAEQAQLAAQGKPPMLTEATWDDFASAGLFWWVNRVLHLFGWALVRECDSDGPDAKVLRVYPARCRFRGFSEDVEADGFRRLTRHVRDNADRLVAEADE